MKTIRHAKDRFDHIFLRSVADEENNLVTETMITFSTSGATVSVDHSLLNENNGLSFEVGLEVPKDEFDNAIYRAMTMISESNKE